MNSKDFMNIHLQNTFGNIDIYLFDQLLKGRFGQCEKIIDIGCGSGRNLVYFLQQDIDIYGVDQNPDAIIRLRTMAKELAPQIPQGNFVVSEITQMQFPKETFDLAICSAVLHFAKDKKHFEDMLVAIWEVIKPGGFFFARLASDIGIEKLVKPLGNGRYHLPDGSERFLVNQKMLFQYTKKLNGALYEPLKTTNVQNQRCMTTWCLQKK